jgi:methyl coenzyme M reductase subunit C
MLSSTELRLKAALIERGCDVDTDSRVKDVVDRARNLARYVHVPRDKFDEVVKKILEAVS